ncbi:MAG: hypothetical protein FE835_17015 [Gammaproteobacteria bacterium]|nr:hypothetical protein [Gammaproteobacteria bacterium]
MGAKEIETILSHLAVDKFVTASIQNQALSAILFLYRVVIEKKCWCQRRKFRES